MDNLLGLQIGVAVSTAIILADFALLAEPLRGRPHVIGPICFVATALSSILLVGCVTALQPAQMESAAFTGSGRLLWLLGFLSLALASLAAHAVFALRYSRYLVRRARSMNANHRDPLFWDMSASAIDHAVGVLFTAPADMSEEQRAGLQGLFDWADKAQARKRKK